MIAIAQSLADSVRRFLRKMFKRLQSSSPTVTPEAVQEKKPRKVRKYDKEKAKTFSDLLDNLEYTFDSVKLPTMKESWLERDSVVGLKKLGAHVPNPWVMLNLNDAKVDVTKPLPAIMCISTATVNTVNTKKYHYPKIMFAVVKKTPVAGDAPTGNALSIRYGV